MRWHKGLTVGSDGIGFMLLAGLPGCSVDLLDHDGQVEYSCRGSREGEDGSSGEATLLDFG